MARCLRFRGIAVFIAVLTIFALFGCGGGGGGGAQPAPAPTHIYGISARGGVGNAVSGGDGGEVEISNADPEGITILETGSVDTSFTATASSTAGLGSNPLIVNSDIPITPDITGVITNGSAPATGLKVNAGVTLTIIGTGGIANISLTNALIVEGTIVTAADNLNISTGLDGAYILSTGVINTSGALGIAAGDISITTQGVLINNGKIYANGGDGSAGGNGATITLEADLDLSNTGNINSNGGTGISGAGGQGGGITLRSNAANVRNSGSLTSNGGNGTEAGGSGGFIILEAIDTGDVVNSGNLTANGGDATTSGGGGSGGDIWIFASTGTIKSTGALSANGGTATGATNVGGDGGTINILNGDLTSAGVIQIAANISANGGDGPNGGAGGLITISQDDTTTDAVKGGIELYNYNSADFSGGGGISNGGSASAFAVIISAFGGPIINQMEINGTGGDASGSAGVAGFGAGIQVEALTDLTNTGAITVTGGSSPFVGGSATGVTLIAGNHVTNSGNILCNGGNATTSVTDSQAGNGGAVVLGSVIGQPAPTVPTSNTASVISVAKGSGGVLTAGPGSIVIDGVDVTPTDGTLP